MKTIFIVLLISTTAIACGSESESNNGNNTPTNGKTTPTNGKTTPKKTTSDKIEVPTTYNFESKFMPGKSSIKYTGQTFRHLLISDLKTYIGGMTAKIDSEEFTPTEKNDVISALDTYFRFDSAASGTEDFLLTTTPATKHKIYDDISSGKNLFGKLAGNDKVTDHKDWTTEFKGWKDWKDKDKDNSGSITSPEGLIVTIFETLERQAIARVVDGPTIVIGEESLPVYITKSGIDLLQLSHKLLLMGITFSQGTDDYLDDDIDGKGLLSPNTRDADKPYTKLERAWDEGFGYFGAARDYLAYDDIKISAKEFIDTDADGAIDMRYEKNWGASINAAKRDKGSQTGTDFTQDIMDAFLKGRTLITNAGETLTDAEMTELKAYRDEIVMGWEKAIAATIIHYINDTTKLLDGFKSEAENVKKLAKFWSEMKGFSLGLQFNPRSPMLTDFEAFHDLVGDAPPKGRDAPPKGRNTVKTYLDNLVKARDLLKKAYGFDTQDVEKW